MTVRQVLAHPAVRRGLIATAIICVAAALAPVIAPYDPIAQPDVLAQRILPPSLAHPFGTDVFSRDVLSRVLYGARLSLLIALLAVSVSVIVGTAAGLAAGFAGGVFDTVLMRVVDGGLAIPRIFLLLMMVALWEGIGVGTLVLILGLTSWFGTSRMVRAEVLSARSRPYVSAARALGLEPLRIALRHVLPNIMAPILVTATLAIGQIVLVEAGLSYLGFGVPAPLPSLGNMISDGRSLLVQAPWISVFPGLVVVATVLSFSVVGEGLRDALDQGHA